MKKTIGIISTGFLLLKCAVGFSQKDSSGIYFTANDYSNHKLSYAINCKTEKHKIKDDMVFHQKEISIKHKGIIYKHPKDSVYGVKYCDGSVARIYNNSEYPILNPDETILIYKVTSGTGGKNSPTIVTYYFSKDAKSSIQPLTIHNIKAVFPENHKFHDLVDMEFHSDDELYSYDEIHKMMKINRVFKISQ